MIDLLLSSHKNLANFTVGEGGSESLFFTYQKEMLRLRSYSLN